VKQPFCVTNFRTTNKLFCSRFTDEPFSATSRCTVSSSADCRNPTLPHDDKQCAFWNIATRWTEVHSRFCAVTVQHTAQSVSASPTFCSPSTPSIYLAITGLDVLASCLPSVKRSPHRLLDTCLSTDAYVIKGLCQTINQQTYLISLVLKPNGWIIQTHATVLMYLTYRLSWTAYWQEHVGMNGLSRLGWQHWAAGVPPCKQCFQIVETLHFDTASTANSEQFCDLC
jgi:hypothetical protein